MFGVVVRYNKIQYSGKCCDSERLLQVLLCHLLGAHFGLLLQPSVSLLSDCEPDSFALGKGHMWLVCLANNEDVADSRGELVACVILHVNNVK